MSRGRWYFQEWTNWVEADLAVSQKLEKAFQQRIPSCEVVVGGSAYRVDFSRRRMHDLNAGHIVPIKREEVSSANPYEIDPYANPKLQMKKIEAFFQKHHKVSDCDENCIQGEGLISLCTDLGISLDDESLLLLACRVQASEPFKIGGEEFKTAMRCLGIDNVKDLKNAIPTWKKDLAEKRHFKYFYWFAFDWTREENMRVMQYEPAIESWQQLLKPRAKDFPIDLWCEFIASVHKKAISKDVWKSLLDFMLSTEPDLSNYSEDEGWPVLIDEFVEWAKPQLQKGKN
ncbi:Defective in cullin neddylation protein [Diplonema papillatum]|nr:Defective in cullin neddylation protein [Diplonema papillatum]